ncbi:uncharacterized protein ELE39_003473 [Cryptosporidium sp. chipmunk genotype I]|uniref:uncharacterized protein n=1 Tax=Cryptosporidium sp. chipmunk genotype I TaxID=1280935 RepID=UPI00351A85E2|nr:hypothetical protein ELE39_003473 [Cryptosporidium sp. chipmunk genotype I]
MKYIKLYFIILSAIILLYSFGSVKSEAPDEFFVEEEGESTTSSSELTLTEEFRVKLLFEDFILMEMEFFLVGMKNLIGSELWIDLHQMNTNEDIVAFIVSHWKNINNPNHSVHKQKFVKYYLEKQLEIKREVLSDYNSYRESSAAMVTKFVKNVSKLNCYRLKSSLILMYLIFHSDSEYMVSAFLLYLLICSFRELTLSPFSLSFAKVMKNEEELGSKMIVLGGDLVSRLIFSIQRVSYQFFRVQYTISAENQSIRNPINTDTIIIEEFGYKFCLSILELAANETGISDLKFLLLFFGSRMDMAAEVLLSIDILKEAIRLGTYITEAISLLFNDFNVFRTIVSKIMDLYGLDISKFKNKFGECINIKEKYPILNGIVNTTDYLKKAKNRSRNGSEKSKIALRSKYSFF